MNSRKNKTNVTFENRHMKLDLKAFNTAELLDAIGWRANCDAQWSEITKAVEDGRLLHAIVEDLRYIAAQKAIYDTTPKPASLDEERK